MEKEAMKDVHQYLMNKAYEKWGENERISYSTFLDKVTNELGPLFFNAVISGNFNYQVQNGGFGQWDDNGYSITLDDLRTFFETNFKDNETIKNVLSIIEEVDETLCWVERGKSLVNRMDYDYQDLFLEALEERQRNDMNVTNSKYYKISKKVEEILEEYFKNEYLKISTEIREENT